MLAGKPSGGRLLAGGRYNLGCSAGGHSLFRALPWLCAPATCTQLQDGNVGLVKLTIEGHAKRQIQKLTQTYLTLRCLLASPPARLLPPACLPAVATASWLHAAGLRGAWGLQACQQIEEVSIYLTCSVLAPTSPLTKQPGRPGAAGRA